MTKGVGKSGGGINVESYQQQASTRAAALADTVNNSEAKPSQRKSALRELKDLANNYDSAAKQLGSLYENRKSMPSYLRRSLGRSTRAKTASVSGGEAVKYTRERRLADAFKSVPQQRAKFDQKVATQDAQREALQEATLQKGKKSGWSLKSLRRSRSTRPPAPAAVGDRVTQDMQRQLGSALLTNQPLTAGTEQSLMNAVERDPARALPILSDLKREIEDNVSFTQQARDEKLLFIQAAVQRNLAPHLLTNSPIPEKAQAEIRNLATSNPDLVKPALQRLQGEIESSVSLTQASKSEKLGFINYVMDQVQ